ncbi:methyltransferase family protein [Plantactinospora alkalitolerans]|nr:isoprenylcysteine carboxylmethyltransferase family protein [Plantactinospora alkalitolerans]
MVAWLALAVYLAGLVTAFGVRTWLHRAATGDSGFRRGAAPFGGGEWWAQALFGAALLLGVVAPVLGGTGLLGPIALLDRPVFAVVGLVLAVVGWLAVLAAQSAMSRSWRIGVDPDEHTELVTGGVFGLVRNPIFTSMTVLLVGLTAMVPNWVQLLALGCLVAGMQLQVRVVEEPYLGRTHGTAYADYRARVGRFLPRLG